MVTEGILKKIITLRISKKVIAGRTLWIRVAKWTSMLYIKEKTPANMLTGISEMNVERGDQTR